MSSGLQVNAGAMDVNGKDTIANAEYFQTELNSLRSDVDNLMSIWKGASATEFYNSYEDQAKNLDSFRQLLNDLGESISASANILNKTEEENASAGAHLF